MTELAPPIPYRPDLEKLEENEEQTIRELIETLLGISRTVYDDSGHALRSVHAKGHGLFSGELVVLDNLPPTLQQGLFASPGRYRAIGRLSTPAGDVLSDRVSLPRGFALKILGVEGERLPGSEADRSQDFVMVNGPAFMAPSLKAFLANLKMLAATTDKAEGAKRALSMVLRGTEKVIEAVGGESSTIKALGGHPLTHPLGETFFTQAPLRYGDYVAKFCLEPSTQALAKLKDAPLPSPESDDALREAVNGFLATHDAEWELKVQLCRDLEKMPIEDSSVPWSEDQSPFVTVARLSVPKQAGWDERCPAREDQLSFAPWRGLAAHQPLGSIMRGRRPTYHESVNFRSTLNRCPVSEPPP